MDSSSAIIAKLNITRSNLVALVSQSLEQNKKLAAIDSRLSNGLETLSVASDAVAPLQTQSMAVKALNLRINRAVPSALSLLHSFSLVDSLHRQLSSLSDQDPTDDTLQHPAWLLKYVDCVDRLNEAIEAVTSGCEPAVMKLQEAIEFLSRTKATDQLRIRRLRETLGAIKALYEGEVDAMKYEGLLDEALLRLQAEYEGILQQIRHKEIGEGELGSDIEVEVLERISKTLASNDCLDICIDIYVKVRYRRAAKALMRLNPRYLKTYLPEDIDNMEWEALESSITHWIDHFQLAVKSVFVSEKQLCRKVLMSILDDAVWSECFAKIADKIIAVFFRFGEGVACSSKEPQKLFKLLDMYDALDKIRVQFSQVFDGDSCTDMCARFRELQKLLVDSASKVFWEFGLQIEEDGAPPPVDGSIPKVVRYAVNYLKCLAGGGYRSVMGQVLRTEQMWKAGYLSKPDPDESLLREAIWNALDALYRNVESKRSRYKDKVAGHVLPMNTYWYMYMRIRGSDLGKLVGEETVKKTYKSAAEEAAYSYQALAWGPLLTIGTAELFIEELDERVRRHRSCYCISELDLREQIKQVVVKIVVPAYGKLVDSNLQAMRGRNIMGSDDVKKMLEEVFGGEDEGKKANVGSGKMYVRRREAIYHADRKTEEGEERKETRMGRRGTKSAGKMEEIEGGGRFGKGIENERGGSFGRRKEREEWREGNDEVEQVGDVGEYLRRREMVGKKEKEEGGRFRTREETEDDFEKEQTINQENNNLNIEKKERRRNRFHKSKRHEENSTQLKDDKRSMDPKRGNFAKNEGADTMEERRMEDEEIIGLKRAAVDGGKRVFRKREFKDRINKETDPLNNGKIIEA